MYASTTKSSLVPNSRSRSKSQGSASSGETVEEQPPPPPMTQASPQSFSAAALGGGGVDAPLAPPAVTAVPMNKRFHTPPAPSDDDEAAKKQRRLSELLSSPQKKKPPPESSSPAPGNNNKRKNSRDQLGSSLAFDSEEEGRVSNNPRRGEHTMRKRRDQRGGQEFRGDELVPAFCSLGVRNEGCRETGMYKMKILASMYTSLNLSKASSISSLVASYSSSSSSSSASASASASAGGEEWHSIRFRGGANGAADLSPLVSSISQFESELFRFNYQGRAPDDDSIYLWSTTLPPDTALWKDLRGFLKYEGLKFEATPLVLKEASPSSPPESVESLNVIRMSVDEMARFGMSPDPCRDDELDETTGEIIKEGCLCPWCCCPFSCTCDWCQAENAGDEAKESSELEGENFLPGETERVIVRSREKRSTMTMVDDDDDDGGGFQGEDNEDAVSTQAVAGSEADDRDDAARKGQPTRTYPTAIVVYSQQRSLFSATSANPHSEATTSDDERILLPELLEHLVICLPPSYASTLACIPSRFPPRGILELAIRANAESRSSETTTKPLLFLTEDGGNIEEDSTQPSGPDRAPNDDMTEGYEDAQEEEDGKEGKDKSSVKPSYSQSTVGYDWMTQQSEESSMQWYSEPPAREEEPPLPLEDTDKMQVDEEEEQEEEEEEDEGAFTQAMGLLTSEEEEDEDEEQEQEGKEGVYEFDVDGPSTQAPLAGYTFSKPAGSAEMGSAAESALPLSRNNSLDLIMKNPVVRWCADVLGVNFSQQQTFSQASQASQGDD